MEEPYFMVIDTPLGSRCPKTQCLAASFMRTFWLFLVLEITWRLVTFNMPDIARSIIIRKDPAYQQNASLNGNSRYQNVAEDLSSVQHGVPSTANSLDMIGPKARFSSNLLHLEAVLCVSRVLLGILSSGKMLWI